MIFLDGWGPIRVHVNSSYTCEKTSHLVILHGQPVKPNITTINEWIKRQIDNIVNNSLLILLEVDIDNLRKKLINLKQSVLKLETTVHVCVTSNNKEELRNWVNSNTLQGKTEILYRKELELKQTIIISIKSRDYYWQRYHMEKDKT